MNSNFKKMMERVNESRHHIYFWRSEYRKRKFMIENPDKYKSFPELIKSIYRDLDVIFNEYPRDRRYIGNDYYDKLQQCVIYEFFRDYKTPVYIGKYDVRNFFSCENISKIIWNKVLETCFCSFEYDYYISFLSSKCDMYKILKLLSEGLPLPNPPETHLNKTQKDFIPSHLLKVLRINRDKDENDSTTKQILTEYEKQFPRLSRFGITKSQKRIDYDIAILADIFSKDFDIEKSIDEIREKIVYMIYEYKSRSNIDLNEKEINALSSLFNKFANGNTKPSHSHSRATGLWVWDFMYFNTKFKTQSSVYRKYNELDVNKYHIFDGNDVSSRRNFDRIMASTNSSINKGEVLPISG